MIALTRFAQPVFAAPVPGIQLAFDHRRVPVGIGSPVSQWTDMVRGAVSFTGASNLPTRETTGVRFTAASSTQLRYAAIYSLFTVGAAVIVYTPRTAHAGTFLGRATGTNALDHRSNVQLRIAANIVSDLATPTTVVGTRRIAIFQGDASGRAVFVDNVAGGTAASAWGNFSFEYLGSYGGSSYINCDIEHILVLNRVTNAGDRTALQTWFQDVAPA